MRLFVLYRSLLAPLAASNTFRPGDVIAYFREGQDMDGSARVRLQAAGVTVVAAESLVSGDEALALEKHFQAALFRWYRQDDGSDATAVDGLSFGYFMSPRIRVEFSFLFLVRAGMIFSRLLQPRPGLTEVITDIVDGLNIHSDNSHRPEQLLWRTLLGDLTAARQVPVRDLPAPAVLPHMFSRAPKYGLSVLFRPFLAGCRPRTWLRRVRNCRKRDGLPTIFAFYAHNLEGLLRGLADTGRLRVVADHYQGHGVYALAPGQLWALPGLGLLRALWRTRRHIARIARHGLGDPALTWEGIDYSPYLIRILSTMSRHHLPVFLMVTAQVRKLMRKLKPDMVVVSGDYLPHTLATFEYCRRTDTPCYFVNHGYDLAPVALYASSMAERCVTYIAEGSDIAPIYGFHLPADQKPQVPVVTSPAMTPMLPLRGRRKTMRRVLVTGYSSYTPHTVTRSAHYDGYLIDIIATARALKAEGITTVYRPHPSERRASITEMLALLGGQDVIELDYSPTFADALAKCDVYVCNATTCYYQALFAGWPTIYFEPCYDPRFYIGLPAAADTGRPLATDREQLLGAIRAAYTPDSEVARFPERFNNDLAERFIGHAPEHADIVLAQFFQNELAERHRQ